MERGLEGGGQMKGGTVSSHSHCNHPVNPALSNVRIKLPNQ